VVQRVGGRDVNKGARNADRKRLAGWPAKSVAGLGAQGPEIDPRGGL
jgi:hypothetical protein